MKQIFARASGQGSEVAEMAEPAEPTIAQIVDRVRMPSALKAAMQSWRGLQEQYATLSEEMRAAVGELHRKGGGDGAVGRCAAGYAGATSWD